MGGFEAPALRQYVWKIVWLIRHFEIERGAKSIESIQGFNGWAVREAIVISALPWAPVGEWLRFAKRTFSQYTD